MFSVWFQIVLNVLLFAWLICGCAVPPAYAINADRLCDAIYKAEGGVKTAYPFGIKSVHCDGYQDCKDVCVRTVAHKHRDWLKTARKTDYLTYLASKYAPKSDSPLNANWERNVTYYYNKGAQ